MAKIRKCKLTWNASKSKNIAGYRVYWSEGDNVEYDSEYIDLFNLTQLVISDEVVVLDKPVMFGVSTIDFDGNESDITKLPEHFQVNVPKSPASLSLNKLEKFRVLDLEKTVKVDIENDGNADPIANAIKFQEEKTDKHK